jgi:type IV secretion system protein TrbL
MPPAVDTSILTALLNAFATVLTGSGFLRLMPDALWLLQRLALIEIVMVAVWWGLSQDDVVVAFLTKMLWIGFFVALVSHWPWLVNLVMRSFIEVGLKGAGGVLTVEDFSNPARIAKFGFEVVAVLAAKLQGYSGLWSIMNLPLMVIEGFVFIGVTLAFGLLAIQIFITFVEFYLVALLTVMLVPFGVFRHTAFLAEKAIGSVVAFGIKLMVLACIANLLQPVMETLRLTAQPGINELMALLLGSWAITLLAWHAPGIAAGLLSGSPTLTAHTVAQTALATVAGTAVAGLGAMGAGTMAVRGTQRAVRYGSAATEAYRVNGMRGVGQVATASVAYQTQLLTAGFRGAAASGRIYGANLSAVPWNPGGPRLQPSGGGISARMLASRIIPPAAHAQGGVQVRLPKPPD